MRPLILLASVLCLAGCTITRPVAPREYLDEETAATITMTPEPWSFMRKDAPPQLDFVDLYAIDVNRQGTHKKYLVMLQYWPPANDSTSPRLEITTGEQVLSLEPLPDDARTFGVGQPLVQYVPRSAKWWFYTLDKTSLEALGTARELSVTLVTGETRADYIVWRDGSAQLSEFAAMAHDL